jgi:hypothetical protein
MPFHELSVQLNIYTHRNVQDVSTNIDSHSMGRNVSKFAEILDTLRVSYSSSLMSERR